LEGLVNSFYHINVDLTTATTYFKRLSLSGYKVRDKCQDAQKNPDPYHSMTTAAVDLLKFNILIVPFRQKVASLPTSTSEVKQTISKVLTGRAPSAMP